MVRTFFIMVLALTGVMGWMARAGAETPGSPSPPGVSAQTVGAVRPTPKPSHAGAPVDCRLCHSCQKPTEAAPCLIDRPVQRVPQRATPGEVVPEIVVIGQLANLFAPTRFNHKAHAEMAAMGGGCQSCHHNVAPGQEHIACRSCHIDGINMENLSQPGLRGVYHRLCMRCHENWNTETECQNCHARKTNGSEPQAMVLPPEDHPASTIKDLIVFETGKAENDRVPFHHKRHTEIYGFDCQMCHKSEGCYTCHGQARNALAALHDQTFREHHAPCFQCHSTNSCDHCHGRDPNDLFVHPEVKSLKREVFVTMACRSCHGHGGPYQTAPRRTTNSGSGTGETPPAPGGQGQPPAPTGGPTPAPTPVPSSVIGLVPSEHRPATLQIGGKIAYDSGQSVRMAPCPIK
ncbi:MAG: hypothetical protein Kow0059_16040 [Candidatus Sumerlaeia bacterium]